MKTVRFEGGTRDGTVRAVEDFTMLIDLPLNARHVERYRVVDQGNGRHTAFFDCTVSLYKEGLSYDMAGPSPRNG